MYTEKVKCTNGYVTVKYTSGNVPIRAESDTHIAKNPYGLSSDDLHEIFDTAGGNPVYQNRIA